MKDASKQSGDVCLLGLQQSKESLSELSRTCSVNAFCCKCRRLGRQGERVKDGWFQSIQFCTDAFSLILYQHWNGAPLYRIRFGPAKVSMSDARSYPVQNLERCTRGIQHVQNNETKASRGMKWATHSTISSLTSWKKVMLNVWRHITIRLIVG